MEMTAGMVMLLKSLLGKLGVDARKIEDALTVGTTAANGIRNGVIETKETLQRIEYKLDLLIASLPAKDCGETVAYLTDGSGNLETVTGNMEEILAT